MQFALHSTEGDHSSTYAHLRCGAAVQASIYKHHSEDYVFVWEGIKKNTLQIDFHEIVLHVRAYEEVPGQMHSQKENPKRQPATREKIGAQKCRSATGFSGQEGPLSKTLDQG